MAYIFHQDQLPRLEGATGGRVRTFFVNKELAKIDDMLVGVMTYTKGTASPLHYHEVCEHFYFIMEGNAQVETPEGIQPVGPGMMSLPGIAGHLRGFAGSGTVKAGGSDAVSACLSTITTSPAIPSAPRGTGQQSDSDLSDRVRRPW